MHSFARKTINISSHFQILLHKFWSCNIASIYSATILLNFSQNDRKPLQSVVPAFLHQKSNQGQVSPICDSRGLLIIIISIPKGFKMPIGMYYAHHKIPARHNHRVNGRTQNPFLYEIS